MPEKSPSDRLIQILRVKHAFIGKNVYLGIGVFIELENAAFLTIEDNVVVAAHTQIVLHDSSLNNVNGFDMMYGDVVLKKNCYIGAGSLILPGSQVGENSIIGAGSLVKGNIPADSVYVGRPAKYQCTITELEAKWKHRKNTRSPNHYYFIPSPPFRNRSIGDTNLLEREKLSIKKITIHRSRKQSRILHLFNKLFIK